jgi:oligopeptide transport system substrate-binding protein
MVKRLLYSVLSLLLLISLLVGGCLPGWLMPSTTPAAGGGVLNLYGIDPHTLDPAVASEANSGQYILQVFSGLVRLDDNLEPAPDIAERWEISNGGRTYTFYLRHGVKFQDGRLMKAEDVKFSWQRAADPATGSLTAAAYLGDIVGVKEVLAGKTKEISGVKIIDEYTLQVTIDAPRSYFLPKLTYPTAFVVDKDNVGVGGEWWRSPNGTGPFKLTEWTEGSQLVLERNDLYYGKVASVGSVVFHLLSGFPMDMYETGQIDVAGVSLDYIDRVTDKAGPFYRELTIVPELSFSYIGFNSAKPPFDDANIRRAFSMAIDKDKLVSLVFRDMVQRADGILPPGIPGFNKDLVGLKYDVNQAKDLIKRSRYGDVAKLPPITLTTYGYGGAIAHPLEAIIQQWRENLGVEVKVRQLEPDYFLYHLMEEKDELFEIGWIADYPHPEDFLDILFHSGGDNNWGEYINPEIDTLLERAAVEPDTDKSLALYRQIEQKLVTDAACLPLWFSENYILVKPYVKGYKLNPLGFAMLNEVSVEGH